MDPIQGRAPAIDLEFLDRLPAQERAEQSTQAQDVIQVSVGKKHPR